MSETKLPLRDVSLIDVVAAAIVIQTVSSGPDFVTLNRLRETIDSMRAQAPGTGWVCAAQVQARGVVTALGLYDLQRPEQSFGDAPIDALEETYHARMDDQAKREVEAMVENVQAVYDIIIDERCGTDQERDEAHAECALIVETLRSTVQALRPSHVPSLMHVVSMLDHGNTKVAREEAMRLLNEVRGRE